MNDRYGVPRYQEANPALFSCVTFPFLFGVMFGDVGHGTLLFLGALALVLYEKRLEGKDLGEVPGMLYTGRYMLLLMGIFATYCGLIYNECFCLPLNLFGTIFEKNPATSNQSATYFIKDDPHRHLYVVFKTHTHTVVLHTISITSQKPQNHISEKNIHAGTQQHPCTLSVSIRPGTSLRTSLHSSTRTR